MPMNAIYFESFLLFSIYKLRLDSNGCDIDISRVTFLIFFHEKKLKKILDAERSTFLISDSGLVIIYQCTVIAVHTGADSESFKLFSELNPFCRGHQFP